MYKKTYAAIYGEPRWNPEKIPNNSVSIWSAKGNLQRKQHYDTSNINVTLRQLDVLLTDVLMLKIFSSGLWNIRIAPNFEARPSYLLLWPSTILSRGFPSSSPASHCILVYALYIQYGPSKPQRSTCCWSLSPVSVWSSHRTWKEVTISFAVISVFVEPPIVCPSLLVLS